MGKYFIHIEKFNGKDELEQAMEYLYLIINKPNIKIILPILRTVI